jgi:hypothetical protein
MALDITEIKIRDKVTIAGTEITSVETTLTGGNSALPRADAVKAYVDSLLNANDAMQFKGTIGTGGTVTALPTTHSAGWTYRVITAATYAGVVTEVGDLIIAVIDRAGTGNANSDWTVVQTNIDGAVVGPASAISANVARFNGTSGKLIQDSGISFETTLTTGSDAKSPTSKAVATYVTGLGYTTNTGTVTGVTGTAPIASSGGTAPVISITAATTSAAGSMSSADKTKLDGIATGAQVNVGTNLTWTAGTTAGPTVNSSTGTGQAIPSASISASGAVTTGAQEFAGNKTFRAATTQDGIVLAGRAGGTGSFGVTLTPTTLTASRTLTLPDAAGTVALTSQIPAAANNATLSLTATAGATNTSVTIGTGTGFSANDSTNRTYDIDVGPALTNLATTMTGAGTGILRKTAADTYEVVANTTYLTAHPTITVAADTTSTASPAFGGTFTAIDGVTRDGNGHVTTLNTKTVTIPTPSYPTVNNGTLTLAVSGTGLSGSASFTANQSTASTFTVTSNATSANTASAIVARDASGNFSAGTITASLSGNASTVTNGVYTTGSQSIAGNKTFTDGVYINGSLNSDGGTIQVNVDSFNVGGGISADGTMQAIRFTSTQATGTAPLTVASTTAVTNLNADLLDGNHASAFALASHTHGNILSNGTITTNTAPSSGQHLVITSSGNLIQQSSIELGSSTTSFLRNDGQWITPAGGGDVVGPASSTAGRVATFNGTTGKLIQDGGVLLSNLVSGPASAVTTRLAAFNGTSGKLLYDSGFTTSSFAAASHNHAVSNITSGSFLTQIFATTLAQNTASSSITVASGTARLWIFGSMSGFSTIRIAFPINFENIGNTSTVIYRYIWNNGSGTFADNLTISRTSATTFIFSNSAGNAPWDYRVYSSQRL